MKNSTKDSKTKKSLLKSSRRRIFWLGLIILICVCIVAGIQFFYELMNANCKLAYAYVKDLMIHLSGEPIEELIDHQKDISDIYNTLLSDRALWISLLESSDPLADNLVDVAGVNRENANLFVKWNDIVLNLYTIIVFNEGLERYQIIVPTEEDAIILCYADDQNSEIPIGTHRPYLTGEKERLTYSYYDLVDESLLVNRENGHLCGTAMYPVYGSNGNVVAYAELDISIDGIWNTILKLVGSLLAIVGACIAAAMILYGWLLKRKTLSPIKQLQEMTSNVVEQLKNDDDVPIESGIHTDDEIEALAHSYEEMVKSLRSYIKENAEMAAGKRQISLELQLASNIQSGRLPSVFPPFPDRKEFDIYASMTPAKEIGGDFYDFFFVDENTLGLVIADVSGKGIPAALFMMETMIRIENQSNPNSGPAEILDRVNKKLYANNKGKMFVTVWLGLLDLTSGRLRAANAGHLYPILRKKGEPFQLYKDKHGFIVAGREKITYPEYELTLTPGSELFLYTDGVTEAKDPDGNLFGTQRTLDALNQVSGGTPEELLASVDESIHAFIKDAEQYDDLTMMCLQYHGPANYTGYT